MMMMAAALVAMTLTPPAMAQTPPQMEVRVNALIDGSFRTFYGSADRVDEGADCTANDFAIQVGHDPVANRPVAAVRVFALTLSGPDRFGNRGSPIELTPAAKNSQIRASTTVNVGRNGGWFGTGLCFKDDTLDTGPSVVEVVIANGPGYTVHPDRGRIEFTITDNDDCATPAGTPGGVVWKESGCRCATQSTHDSVRQLASPMPLEGQSEAVWRQNLRHLAAHFSDPSYLYCADSPWKGLP